MALRSAKASALALAAGLLASGCEQHVVGPVGTTSTLTITTTMIGGDAAQLERLAALPDCAKVQQENGQRRGIPQLMPDPKLDCALRSSDERKLTLEVLGSPPITVKVFDSSGAQRQVFRQNVNSVYEYVPFLDDLDKDGRDEVVIVTRVGNGWEDMAIWRATGESAVFVDAGEVDGSTKFWKTADGFVATYAHTGAGSGAIPMMRFEGDQLVVEAMLDVAVPDWPDEPNFPHEWVFSGNTKCALTNIDDPKGLLAKQSRTLASLGIDPATASEHFCSEPWVATLYRKS